MQKHIGLIGKIGPAFKNDRSSDGLIEIADLDNDSTWTLPIPGDYFARPRSERFRAAFDHLIAND